MLYVPNGFPRTRMSLWSVVTHPIRFYQHLQHKLENDPNTHDDQDKHCFCAGIILYVELPRVVAFALSGVAGVVLGAGHYAMTVALLALAGSLVLIAQLAEHTFGFALWSLEQIVEQKQALSGIMGKGGMSPDMLKMLRKKGLTTDIKVLRGTPDEIRAKLRADMEAAGLDPDSINVEMTRLDQNLQEQAQEHENPIDKLIRESQELFRRNQKGTDPVS